MRKEEPNTSQIRCKHSTDACATEPTHAAQYAFRHLADRHPYRRIHNACSTWEQGLRCRGLGNLCKAGLPSARQNAAHVQITERKDSIARTAFALRWKTGSLSNQRSKATQVSKGTGFSPYVKRRNFLKGTGFSPYTKRRKVSGALAPEAAGNQSGLKSKTSFEGYGLQPVHQAPQTLRGISR
jgi:hypothetical protein